MPLRKCLLWIGFKLVLTSVSFTNFFSQFQAYDDLLKAFSERNKVPVTFFILFSLFTMFIT